MMHLKYLLIALSVTLGYGCRKQQLSPADYISWVNDEANGLRKSKTFKGIVVMAQYRPVEYQVAIEEKTSLLSSEKLNERYGKLKGMQYYLLRFSLEDKSQDIMRYDLDNEAEYYQRLNYCSFGMQNDIWLVQGNDTLSCKLFNAVRSYGLSPNADYLLAFEEKDTEHKYDRQLIVNDAVFGLGPVKFKFSEDDLENIPHITTY